MRRLSEALYLIVVALWAGGIWAIGYVAAPILFSSIGDRQLAGMVAGKMFALVGCGQIFKSAVFWLVLFMALMTVASQFGIQPLMAQLKADALPREVMESVLRDRFAVWHGISSILYLMQSGLGLWLVVWANRGLR